MVLPWGRWLVVLPLSRVLFGGASVGELDRGSSVGEVPRGSSSREGLVWRGFRRRDGLWFFLTSEGLVCGVHTVGDEVHVSGVL